MTNCLPMRIYNETAPLDRLGCIAPIGHHGCIGLHCLAGLHHFIGLIGPIKIPDPHPNPARTWNRGGLRLRHGVAFWGHADACIVCIPQMRRNAFRRCIPGKLRHLPKTSLRVQLV